MSLSSKLLEGVKVVELATFVAAPACGRFLADLGAEVIKVESLGGDPVRYTAPTEGRPLDQHENTTWDLENANKQGIALNLKLASGKEVLFKLLDKADIFITNWRPEALIRAGLDYETLKGKYPKLVFATMTGYGEKGPDKDLPGFDFTSFFARGGIMGTLYQKGTVPTNLIPGIGDHQAAMFLCSGVLAALYHAKQTGEGEKVSVNLLHSAIYTQAIMVQAAQYPDHGQVYPIDRRTVGSPFIGAYKTKDDRFIQICMPPYDLYFPKFITVMGRPDLAEDEKYNTLVKLTENKLNTSLFDILSEQFEQKTVKEWNALLTEADIPFSVAQTWEEVLEDKQAWANDVFYSMDYPSGEKAVVRPPVDFTEMGLPEYNKGPLLGEHSEGILRNLGYSEEQIKEMKANKEIRVWGEK